MPSLPFLRNKPKRSHHVLQRFPPLKSDTNRQKRQEAQLTTIPAQDVAPLQTQQPQLPDTLPTSAIPDSQGQQPSITAAAVPTSEVGSQPSVSAAPQEPIVPSSDVAVLPSSQSTPLEATQTLGDVSSPLATPTNSAVEPPANESNTLATPPTSGELEVVPSQTPASMNVLDIVSDTSVLPPDVEPTAPPAQTTVAANTLPKPTDKIQEVGSGEETLVSPFPPSSVAVFTSSVSAPIVAEAGSTISATASLPVPITTSLPLQSSPTTILVAEVSLTLSNNIASVSPTVSVEELVASLTTSPSFVTSNVAQATPSSLNDDDDDRSSNQHGTSKNNDNGHGSGSGSNNDAVDPANTPPSLPAPSSEATEPAKNTTGVVVGSVVGGIAGTALVLVLLLFLLRRSRRSSSSNRLRLGEDDDLSPMGAPPGTNNNGGSGAMSRSMSGGENISGFAASIPAVMTQAFAGAKKSITSAPLLRPPQAYPPPPPVPTASEEKGFYRVAGRKLPSVLQHGGDGYTDPRSSFLSSTSSQYPESLYHGVVDNSNIQYAVGSPMRPVSGIAISRPGAQRVAASEVAVSPFLDPEEAQITPTHRASIVSSLYPSTPLRSAFYEDLDEASYRQH